MGRSLDHLIGELIDAGSREHYADADLYDYEYRRRRADIAFYRGLAGRLADGPGEVLDLGCGSGRLTLALARDGHRVVGVDQSPAMLAGLARRLERAPAAVRGRVEAVPGDLRDFDLGRRFPLVVAAFNVVEHLYTRPEITAWLGQVARHLTPGGHLAFDVQMPDLAWLLRDPSKRWARTRFTHPRTGEKLFYSTNHDYDPVSQIAVIRIYYEAADGGRRSAEGRGRTRVVKLTQRKFFPAELETLLWASGFQLVERYGDFQGGPLDGNAESQVVVCKPRPASSATRIGGSSGTRSTRRRRHARRCRRPPPALLDEERFASHFRSDEASTENECQTDDVGSVETNHPTGRVRQWERSSSSSASSATTN